MIRPFSFFADDFSLYDWRTACPGRRAMFSLGAKFKMTDGVTNKSSTPGGANGRRRLALVSADGADAERLKEELDAAGYEVSCARAEQAAQSFAELAPEVVLAAFEDIESEARLLAFARRLRAESATHALPLVFLFSEDGRALRNAALNIGADDYFSRATPRAEMCARLEALFWRLEAGRRNAPVVGEQRLEIDNFLLLLDHVGADAQEEGASGTVALVGVAGDATRAGDAEAERTLAEAHGFFKLNLRRLDGVAFYGPAILLVYLPRQDARAAQATLARLRDEFLAIRPDSTLAAGLASFPADGTEIEKLIEKAEISLHAARAREAPARVVSFDAKKPAEPSPSHSPAAPTQVKGGAQTTASANTATVNKTSGRAVREKTQPGVSDIVLMSHAEHGAATGDGGNASRQEVADAVMQEREMRARGVSMPRRLLLAVSDAARMAQVNLLIRSAAYEVRAAFDGQQALSLLRIEQPDLVVVDYELHDMNGVEMLKRLRKQSGGRLAWPVLLLLPAEHESARQEAAQVGVRGIVNLPYDPLELLERIRTAGSAE
ncbi:MAG: response regulator [Acidobacteria bacterium]|nr:response regulator [Acidobacteriota bacterium]